MEPRRGSTAAMTVSTRECVIEVTRPAAPATHDAQVGDMGRAGHRGVGVVREWRKGAALSETSPLGRRTLIGLTAFFVVVTFSQSPGLTEFDTKLALVVSPISYFDSFLHPWIAGQFGGAVQQGTSFLWPMGSFFAATHVLHVPVWVAERIWLASILTIGCWGAIRLAEALAIGNRWTRVLAGGVYCTAPIFVTYASTSGDLLAAAFLPWMLRPLVIGSREGSTRRWAARSGVAVALMGGVNAAVTLSVIPLGVIWLLTRQAGPRRRSLAVWWVVALAMACFWWAVPVYYIAHFGYNYLPYTETSSVTTSTTSLFESIRGASFWTNYFNIGGPLLRGAWILVSEPLVILATGVVAATGLAGLCRRIPERLFLVACLTFGVVVIAAGFSGPMGGLFSHQVQSLLQGSLAPFRNVSKFSPDVALPLALGFAAAMVGIPNLARRGTERIWDRRNLPLVSTLVVAVAVIVAAAPFWSASCTARVDSPASRVIGSRPARSWTSIKDMQTRSWSRVRTLGITPGATRSTSPSKSWPPNHCSGGTSFRWVPTAMTRWLTPWSRLWTLASHHQGSRSTLRVRASTMWSSVMTST